MNYVQASDDFLFYLEIEKNYSVNTLNSYAFDLKLFGEFLEENHRSLNLDDITSSSVRRFVQDQVINHNIKPRTLQRRISCLKSFCQYCLKENLMQLDFTAGIVSPKADKKLPKYMTIQELAKLFTYLEKDSGPFALRNELMFKLLATTGMRRQELVDLTWEQIDLDNQTILVRGKGKKERLLPLHPIVLPVFEKYKQTLTEQQNHYSEPIFYNKNYKMLGSGGLHKIFKETLDRAGLPSHRFTLHHLRHTFATLMLQNNKDKVDLRTLQELLGHESLATTSMYTHVDFEQKKKAINSFLFD
ncbi:tyrosine-type recombinase/integrase [Domibacillus mangrovi]|uniref:Integrase n=1 Tax=Domibacillus mangrovi TaxID=1714354 RepID=A0A1Q5P348_9BACI|nr:tyrosine-type recombinase/integrase [Domibacillus mangrovi]OKL36679.1 integrase [Domibacillus mangrovi]